MVSDEIDGLVDLIIPFEKVGRRIVRGWSPAHVAAALPGRRSKFSTSVRDGAWRTIFEVSRLMREGLLPIYPWDRRNADDQISPSTIWLIYPLYPSHPRHSGRGLVELTNGSMIEAVADITSFDRVLRTLPLALPRTGRPRLNPAFFDLAKVFWLANPRRLNTGAVLAHIEAQAPTVYRSVPRSSRYRLIEAARMEARKIR